MSPNDCSARTLTKKLKRFDILRRDCDGSRLRSDAIGVSRAPMPKHVRLTQYSVYVVGRILSMLNIKIEHVIDTGATFTIDEIAEKADQLILMCETASRLDGRDKVRSTVDEDDKTHAVVVFIRSEFRQVGLRIDKIRKRKRDGANKRYSIKLDDDVALMKDYVSFQH